MKPYTLKKKSSSSRNTQLKWWESDTAFVVKVTHVGGEYVGKETLRLLMKDGSCIKAETLKVTTDLDAFILYYNLDPQDFAPTEAMVGKFVYQFNRLVVDSMDIDKEKNGNRRRLVANLYIPLLGLMAKCEGPYAMKVDVIEDLWRKEFRNQFQGCTYHDPDDELDETLEK
jgi:hypothetical protein